MAQEKAAELTKKAPTALVTTAVLLLVALPSAHSLVTLAGFEVWATLLTAGSAVLLVRADRSADHLALKALQWLALTVLCVDLLLEWMWVGMGVQAAMLTIAAIYPRLTPHQAKMLRLAVLVIVLGVVAASLFAR